MKNVYITIENQHENTVMALFQRFLPCSSSLFVCLPGRGFPFVNSGGKSDQLSKSGRLFLVYPQMGYGWYGWVMMGMVLMDDLDDMNG